MASVAEQPGREIVGTGLWPIFQWIRKVTMFVALTAVVWGLSLTVSADDSAEGVLRVAVNNAPPYRIIQEENGSKIYSGFYVEIIRSAASRAGLNLTFYELPFPRALKMMKSGKMDIMLGPNRVPEREVYMDYLPVELPREVKVFYLRPGLADIPGYEALDGKLIGILAKTVYFNRFDEDTTLAKVNVSNYSNALKMTAMGRLDTVIIPELMGDYLSDSLDITLTKSSFRVPGRPSFIVMSKKSPASRHKPALIEALEAMRQDGSLEAVVAKYRRDD